MLLTKHKGNVLEPLHKRWKKFFSQEDNMDISQPCPDVGLPSLVLALFVGHVPSFVVGVGEVGPIVPALQL